MSGDRRRAGRDARAGSAGGRRARRAVGPRRGRLLVIGLLATLVAVGLGVVWAVATRRSGGPRRPRLDLPAPAEPGAPRKDAPADESRPGPEDAAADGEGTEAGEEAPSPAAAEDEGEGEAEPEDSSFVADEQHVETKLGADAGARAGWVEHKDTLRFGRYSFSVVQRLDPATGLPPQERQIWGDTFVGVHGKKPAPYMSSNWSPWDFLSASIGLRGEVRAVANPTRMGRLAYATLRETTRDRIVAEAAWKDAAGGYLRARFVGWRGSNRFGLALRYFPAAGKTVDSFSCKLSCQPYDYHDRGHWERRRWVTTPERALALSKEPVSFDPARKRLFAFHNRFAQNDAGTFLAVDPGSADLPAALSSGNVVSVIVKPHSPTGEAALVLGDWVGEAYGLAAARFFAAGENLDQELAQVASLKPPHPAPLDVGETKEIDALLRRHSGLEGRFGEDVREMRAGIAASLEGLADEDSPRVFAAWSRATRKLQKLRQDLCSAWVADKLFAKDN